MVTVAFAQTALGFEPMGLSTALGAAFLFIDTLGKPGDLMMSKRMDRFNGRHLNARGAILGFKGRDSRFLL